MGRELTRKRWWLEIISRCRVMLEDEMGDEGE